MNTVSQQQSGTALADGELSSDLLAGYVSTSSLGHRSDELVDAAGTLKPHCRPMAEHFARLGPLELQRRRAQIAKQLEQDGVTFNPGVVRSKADRPARPWRLDPVPLVLSTEDWSALAAGLEQRAHLLDAVLTDLYGEQRLLRDRSLPPELILADPAFLRECHGTRLGSPHQLIMAGLDLLRDPDGQWRCYGSQTERPTGMAYSVENRRISARVFQSLFRRGPVRRLAPFMRAYRSTIQSLAPAHIENPSVVVLSPGPLSETAFEHGAVASRLGYPLVEGSDLRIKDGRVWLRTVSGHLPIHVILRQVAPAFCDPLELRADSMIGIPGLVDAARAGEVAVMNTLGSGVLENRGLETFFASLAPKLLGQDLLLRGLDSWWCGDETSLSHVLANLDSLLIRPVASANRANPIDAARLSSEQLTELRRRVKAEPTKWVAQERVEPSTSPTLVHNRLLPQSTVLRGFVVADGDGYRAMAGGLARTSNDPFRIQLEDRLGAVAKDTWVLGVDDHAEGELGPVRAAAPAGAVELLPARAAQNLFWLGRYAERAEATVRLLRVVNQRRSDFEDTGDGPGQDALQLLLEATTVITCTQPGFVGDDAAAKLASPSEELFALVADPTREGTVAFAIERMLAAIDVVRDQLSLDTWLVVGSMQRRIEDLTEDDSDNADDDADIETGTENVARPGTLNLGSEDSNGESQNIASQSQGQGGQSQSQGGQSQSQGGQSQSSPSQVEGESGLSETAEGQRKSADDGEPTELSQAERDEAVGAVLDNLLHGLLSLSGLATESMVRDQGWHFMDAGRRVERSLQSTALISAALGVELAPIAEGLVLESVATANESVITYRRRYAWQGRVGTLLNLLVADPGNPRSLRFQLDRLEQDLTVLASGHPDIASPHLHPELAEVRRLLDDLDTERLALPNDDGQRQELVEFVDQVRKHLAAMAENLRVDYFFQQLPQRQVSAPVERPMGSGR